MEASGNIASEKDNQNPVALLIIDVQQGLFEKHTPIYKADKLLENITTLIDRAHRSNAPVFYVQHSDTRALVKGSADWQLHPHLQPLKVDYSIHKQHGNAFEDTSLDNTLRELHVATVVVAGLVTHGCVRATCIGAQELGYNVILVQDGHSNYSKQAAEIIDKWNQKLSARKIELKSTAEITFE